MRYSSLMSHSGIAQTALALRTHLNCVPLKRIAYKAKHISSFCPENTSIRFPAHYTTTIPAHNPNSSPNFPPVHATTTVHTHTQQKTALPLFKWW